MAATEVAILVRAKDEASKTFKQIERAAGGMSKNLKVAAGVAAVGVGALAVGLASCVKEAQEAEQVMAQTNAVLKSTKGIAGVTAKEVTKLATALSKETKFSDEAIQSAENMLLTFTKIGKDVFPDTVETVLDMSQALGQDLQTSAIQLGKALNDPIRGLTSLQRVGVSFSQDQKKMIEALVESGDIMGAQKIILQELSTEFGNSARAAGDTFAGKMAILNNQIGELKEGIGLALLPLLTKLADVALVHVVPALETAIQTVSDFITVISSSLSGDIEKAAEAFAKLPKPLQDVALWLGDNKDDLKAIADTIRDLANDAIQGWVDILNALMPLLTELGKWLVDNKPIAIALAVALGAVLAILIGWPAAVVAVIVLIGVLTTKLQEWRRENEDLDNTLTALTFAINAFVVAITRATKFVEDHKFVQELLIGVLERGAWGVLLIINAIQFGISVYEKATTVAYAFKDALYSVRDAAYGVRDAINEAKDAVFDFPNIPTLPFGVPKVPSIGNPLSSLPGPLGNNAAGTSSWRGGPTWVGEQGPEILVPPAGSRIYSNKDSMAMGGTTVNVEINVTADSEASDSAMQKLARMVRDEAETALRKAAFRGSYVTSGAYTPS